MPRVSINADKYRQFDTGRLIRGYQQRANMTQADMANYLGITQQAYSHKLKTLSFTLKDIQRLYKPLQLSKDEVFWLIIGKEQA